MKRRALTLVFLVAAGILSAPSRLVADKPEYQTYGGIFGAVSNCPDANYALYQFCTNQPYMYVLFKAKGVKRFDGRQVFVQGTPVATSCGLPGVEMKKITIDDTPPTGCPN
ncbi:MAG TPA: hypothetical protein VFC25_11595 [Verrucomicrobiae bacterium]|nr:hypothetical protein [Verrucomicrobiae bacterium]